MIIDPAAPTSHLGDDTLLRMLAAPLGKSGASDAIGEKHLSECARCRDRLDQLADTAGAMGIMGTLGGFQEIDQVVADLIASSATWLTAHSGQPALSRIGEEEVRRLLGHQGRAGLGKLGGIQVLGLIGQGGMGVVLRGHELELDREIAIKLLHPAYRESETVRDRFRREARAIASLSHENVIPIHQVAEEDGLLYFVMPLAEGSLSDWLRSDSPPTTGERLQIALAAARGLAAAHEAGIVHRDIKPANLLLRRATKSVDQRLVWLADFGLARREDDRGARARGDGTPGYVAPEIESGEEGDERSDLFSLGVLFETLFPEDTPDRPNSLIDRLKSLEPSGRPASARDVVRELEGRLSAEQESGAIGRLKRRLMKLAAIFGIGLGLPALGVVGSDLLLGTGWVNRMLGVLHGETVFAIQGRFGVSRGLRLMLNDARDGDVIEVIGSQPVEVAPLIMKGRTITLRSAHRGSPNRGRPQLRLAPDSLDSLIWVDGGTLTIEGLELLQQVEHSTRRPGYSLSPLIRIGGGNLTIINSRIARTGTPPGANPYLILSRLKAPLIRIVDSELEDENGICFGRSSFQPAPRELVQIRNSRFLGRRWIFVDPPEQGRDLPPDVTPEIHFDIRETWSRSEAAFTLSRKASPGQIRIEIQMENCRLETSGPAVVTSLSDAASLMEVLRLQDRGSVLANGHKEVVWATDNVLHQIVPAPPGSPESSEAQWRRLFLADPPGGAVFEGTRWALPPLFSGDDPSIWAPINANPP